MYTRLNIYFRGTKVWRTTKTIEEVIKEAIMGSIIRVML